MKHIWKWLLLALVITEIVLVRLDLLDIGTAIGVVAAVEALVLIVAGRQVLVAIRRFKHDRARGHDAWTALEDGLEAFFPRRVARVIALEPKLWLCLALWLLRRVRLNGNDFPYDSRSILGALLIVVLFTTPVEILLLELLVPWAWLRWLLLVSAVYLVFWAIALYASLKVLPHRLMDNGIRLSYGVLADTHIEYGDIGEVEVDRRQWPWYRNGLHVDPKERLAYLAVAGATDVTIHLRTARPLWRLLGPTHPVTTIHVAVDEPDRMVRELSARMGHRQIIPCRESPSQPS